MSSGSVKEFLTTCQCPRCRRNLGRHEDTQSIPVEDSREDRKSGEGPGAWCVDRGTRKSRGRHLDTGVGHGSGVGTGFP